MSPADQGDYGDEGEQRLAGHLASLRDEPPRPGTALVKHVVRTARWQELLRVPVRAVGNLLGATADGLAMLFGRRRGAR